MPLRLPFILALVLSLVGVSAFATGRPPPVPKLASGPKDTTAYGCRKDRDCVLTRRIDGACCPRLCRSAAMRGDFKARLMPHLKRHCGDAWAKGRCPIAKCRHDPNSYVARCVQSICTKVVKVTRKRIRKRRPRPRRRQR